MDQQVILLAERPCMVPLFFISAALSRRRSDSAGGGPESCCSKDIASGPFVGPYRSQRHDRKRTHGVTTDFIWAKQKSAMGLA